MTLESGTLVPYYLDEENNWGLEPYKLISDINHAISEGTQLRALVIINPGNPTGQVLKQDALEEVLRVCYEESIMVIADEVYQSNIYKEGAEFVSMRKALLEMGEPYASEVELVSMHSISKGFLGECGLRGGYMEVINFSE